MKTRKIFKWFVGAMFAIVALIFGAGNGVFMANAADLPDAGITDSGAGDDNANGISTESQGRTDADPEFYTKEIDKRITKIRPMATPIDQISRYATAQKSGSFEVKYYSVGTRPITCKTSGEITAQSSGQSIELKVDDPLMLTRATRILPTLCFACAEEHKIPTCR